MQILRQLAATMTSVLIVACATGGGLPDAGSPLTGREWVVEDIAGRGIIDDTRVTLTFGADGRLSGQASCNRLLGAYTVNGSNLNIGDAGLTMMMCPPALMDQERQFIDVLNNVQRYRVDASGALVLTTTTGTTITAR
jgi:heat shock protein HslJ